MLLIFGGLGWWCGFCTVWGGWVVCFLVFAVTEGLPFHLARAEASFIMLASFLALASWNFPFRDCHHHMWRVARTCEQEAAGGAALVMVLLLSFCPDKGETCPCLSPGQLSGEHFYVHLWLSPFYDVFWLLPSTFKLQSLNNGWLMQ